jgi:hypothetical protein
MLIAMLFAGCTVAGTDSSDSTDPTDPTDPGEPLDASFVERLTEGYHCGLSWYLSHDEDRSIRLQAALLPGLGHPPDTSDLEEVDATLSVGDDAATLKVYLGRCLMTPGCSDDPDTHTPGCVGDQELFHEYDAVAGEAHLEKNGDGTISGMITDLVLEGQDDEPTVEVAAMDLPAFGEGEQ